MQANPVKLNAANDVLAFITPPQDKARGRLEEFIMISSCACAEDGCHETDPGRRTLALFSAGALSGFFDEQNLKTSDRANLRAYKLILQSTLEGIALMEQDYVDHFLQTFEAAKDNQLEFRVLQEGRAAAKRYIVNRDADLATGVRKLILNKPALA